MAEQLVKSPEQIQEEILSEETDTAIETKSAVWNGRINLELTERTMRKTEKKIVENGEEQKLVEIDEDKNRKQISYPSPEKVYSREAEKTVSHEVHQEQEKEQSSDQKLVLVKINLSRPEPREKQVVEVNTPREELRPTVAEIDTGKTSSLEPEEDFEVAEVETFSFEVSSTENMETPNQAEFTEYREVEGEYREPESKSFSPPEPGVEKPFTQDLERGDSYSIEGGELERDVEPESYQDLSRIARDFGEPEDYGIFGEAVLQAEYSSDSEVTERLVMDLESMFPHHEEVSGSEAVETLWHDYGVEATVAEVPYFSENSGESWEEGWNSFDMVLQMGDMDMTATEYLSSDLYGLGEMEQPVQNSIDREFSTDQAIEFRESENFSTHTGGYEASERTQEAWVEEYGEKVLELDPIERGVYAAFEDGESFRGAPVEPGEIGFMSEDAAEML